MKIGSLFSGGGLGDFGFMAAGMDISWQCEIKHHERRLLGLRYPEAIQYTDIHDLKGKYLEKVDIITGGFPCQPFSTAGKRNGEKDNRHLWPEMLRVIKECRPRWVIGENVAGIIDMALASICADLEKENYEVGEPIVFPSHALGAWHKRDRVWIMAYDRYDGWGTKFIKQQEEWSKEFNTGGTRNVANTSITNDGSCRSREKEGQEQEFRNGVKSFRSYWETEPRMDRVVNGASGRVHRLKMLGNGQVPACTYVIGKMIMEIESNLDG